MSLRDVRDLLGDRTVPWTTRRTRLQGWRGSDAVCADAAAGAQRIGPAVCAAGAVAGALARSPLVLALFAGTAVVGAVAPNHPVESLYNRWASRRGRAALPPNRAGRRLGCALGIVFLGGAAVAFAVGAPVVGLVLALAIGATAAFVAATGICVPSMLLTILGGPERAAAASLVRSSGAVTPADPASG